jgi:hypothetical protein
VAVAVFSSKICSAASVSFSLVSKDFSLAGSEGPALVSAWRCAASASQAVVPICVFGVSAIFLGVELQDFIVSSTSRTLTILFLLGSLLDLSGFLALQLLPKDLKFLMFLSLQLSALQFFSTFGAAVSSSVFCASAGSLASVAEEVSPTNSGTVAGSIKRGR